MKLKQALTSSPVLVFPKIKGEFILDADALNQGIGAILPQKQNSLENVTAHFSQMLNKTERNCCVMRRELLIIVHSVKLFHHCLKISNMNRACFA